MDFNINFFGDSFYLIKFVFSSLVSVLGHHFNTVINFAIIISAVSTIFGLGVSAASRSLKSKKGG